MQEISDRSHSFLELFAQLCVQNGLKTAAACRKFGISRSIYYDILAGRREVSPKMEARLLKVAELPQNRREEITNSLPPPETPDVSENGTIDAASIMRESDAKFTKRIEDLETGARHYFEDAAEVFKQVKSLPKSGHLSEGEMVVLKGMAKSLCAFQPWIEQGLFQLIKDNRILRGIAKTKGAE